MKIIVVDLDGTLCDSAHRDHLAQAKRWEEFHQAAKDDKPRPDVAFLLRFFADCVDRYEIAIVACTGRNERYRNTTLHWLVDNNVAAFDTLLMRPDGDFRPDVEMKPAMLAEWLALNAEMKPEVAFILEDRDKVVEAWRNLGYATWQVAPGGY